MDLEQVKKARREELLKRLHSKVNGKQANRMNKISKNKKMEELKEQMSNGDSNMKENLEKIIKKVKKKNKKKSKVPQTLEQKVKDLEKEFIPNK
tara:strand:+ start:2946 stop:3227 length:282 start_codon:yes stop_codon:yes gene_type:complete